MSNTTSSVDGITDYFGAIRRRKIYVITILPAVMFVTLVAAFAITPQYQSTAVIMLELSSVPKDIIETTVMSYADQQIEIVQNRVMTAEKLEESLKDIDPYPKHKEWGPVDQAQQILADTAIERVDPVTLKPQTESNAFSLHYNNPNPTLAAQIADRLAHLFLAYNQKVRTEAAAEAAGFLRKQSEGVAAQMREVDARIAELKHSYGDALPEYLLRNQTAADDAQRQIDNLQQQILGIQEKESVLALQLSQTSPNLITQSGDLTDVATVRAKLTEAEQRYTPDHPEVKRLRRALETLMAQTSGSGQGAKQAANNPQYLLTETQLRAARGELANLQALANSMRGKLERHRGFVAATPAAEKEISEVLRRKEVLQNQYQHVQDRLQSANLAETFESQQGGERFTLVRAPVVSRLPVYPNRIGLIFLGLLLGGALAGIAVAAAESMDRSVRMARDLALPEGVPLLGSIPIITNRTDRRRRALRVGSFVTAYSVALLVVIAVIVSARHR